MISDQYSVSADGSWKVGRDESVEVVVQKVFWFEAGLYRPAAAPARLHWTKSTKQIIHLVYWPLLCLCRPFCIFERCLDSNPESCRSKQARYQLSHPTPTFCCGCQYVSSRPDPQLLRPWTLPKQGWLFLQVFFHKTISHITDLAPRYFTSQPTFLFKGQPCSVKKTAGLAK